MSGPDGEIAAFASIMSTMACGEPGCRCMWPSGFMHATLSCVRAFAILAVICNWGDESECGDFVPARVADDCDDAASEQREERGDSASGVEGYDGICSPKDHCEDASDDASAGSVVGHCIDGLSGEQFTPPWW